MGKRFPGFHTCVKDSNGDVIKGDSSSSVGEICMRGRNVMMGFKGSKECTIHGLILIYVLF